MALSAKREFNLTYEIEKLKKIVQLPVTNVVFDERYQYGRLYLDENNDLLRIYAKLYVNDDFVGTVPYVSSERGFMYLSDMEVIGNKLAWDKIYDQYRQMIFDKILKQQPLAVTIEIKDYLSLNVKDKDGDIINIAYCTYLNDEWNVIVAGTNPITKVKITKVVIEAPLPPPIDDENLL